MHILHYTEVRTYVCTYVPLEQISVVHVCIYECTCGGDRMSSRYVRI